MLLLNSLPVCLFALLLSTIAIVKCDDESDDESYDDDTPSIVYKRELFKNPLKFLNKCISDHECKKDEFCDHTGINPFGKCALGKDKGQTCMMDRYCRSKACHLLKCVATKPVRDGPCSKDHHDECLPEQYCSHDRKESFKCRDRRCTSACLKDAHCLSNNCSFFRCKKPEKGC